MPAAVASGDLIGRAKGIVIAALLCSSDDAFALLYKQLQAANRKVIDIAAEVVARASTAD